MKWPVARSSISSTENISGLISSIENQEEAPRVFSKKSHPWDDDEQVLWRGCQLQLTWVPPLWAKMDGLSSARKASEWRQVWTSTRRDLKTQSQSPTSKPNLKTLKAQPQTEPQNPTSKPNLLKLNLKNSTPSANTGLWSVRLCQPKQVPASSAGLR